MYLSQPQLTLLFLLGFITYGESTSVKLHVRFDNQTIIGSEITFEAWLEYPERPSYDIEWIENYPKAAQRRFLLGTLDSTNNFGSNFTLTYREKDDYYPGRYTVTVTVSYQLIFFFTVDTKVLHYLVTQNFTGSLQVKQPGYPKRRTTDVSTRDPAEFVINLHDASRYLETAVSVNYTWYRNNTIIANTTVPQLNTTIPDEGYWIIGANLTAGFNETKGNESTIHYKNGSFEMSVDAKVPIHNFGYTGATWFRHGKLLDLKITCEGTGPYTYCWNIIYGPYNHTGNETCLSPSVSNDCEFQITRYFYDTGLYTLLILMNNDVSMMINQSSINVYKATHKPQLSIIVVPITCTIMAIVLVIFGVAYYWENHVRYTVEVADFDFEDSMGITQVTIIDRIRDTIYTWTSRRGDALLQSPDDETVQFGGGVD